MKRVCIFCICNNTYWKDLYVAGYSVTVTLFTSVSGKFGINVDAYSGYNNHYKNGYYDDYSPYLRQKHEFIFEI